MPYDGALVAGLNGTIYAVPASMVRDGVPIYEWHTLTFTTRDEAGVLRAPLNIACGQRVTDRHHGRDWLRCAPMRFPFLERS